MEELVRAFLNYLRMYRLIFFLKCVYVCICVCENYLYVLLKMERRRREGEEEKVSIG